MWESDKESGNLSSFYHTLRSIVIPVIDFKGCVLSKWQLPPQCDGLLCKLSKFENRMLLGVEMQGKTQEDWPVMLKQNYLCTSLNAAG